MVYGVIVFWVALRIVYTFGLSKRPFVSKVEFFVGFWAPRLSANKCQLILKQIPSALRN